MGEINLSEYEKKALAKIDINEFEKALATAVDEGCSGNLSQFQLSSCGPYVARELDALHRALTDHAAAKSSRKREETGERVRRTGYRLSTAVGQMKRRMEVEEEEGQFFQVDDHIMHPFTFTSRLSVRVAYRWRKAVTDEWTFGSITFYHTAQERPNYGAPIPKRKTSAAKQREEQQKRLYDTWEFLMRGALYSVRDYFREGCDGSAIPETYETTHDAHSGLLNNHSTRFWRDEP